MFLVAIMPRWNNSTQCGSLVSVFTTEAFKGLKNCLFGPIIIVCTIIKNKWNFVSIEQCKYLAEPAHIKMIEFIASILHCNDYLHKIIIFYDRHF